MQRESMVFYRSFYEAIKKLPKEQIADCCLALFAYGIDGEEYNGDDPMVDAIYTLCKPQIDSNNKRYKNGIKGGRPTKTEPKENQTETKTKPKHNQTTTKPEPNVNDNVNVNVSTPTDVVVDNSAPARCASIICHDETEWIPDEETYNNLVKAFPEVDVDKEFIKMHEKTKAKKAGRPSPIGAGNYAMTWLGIAEKEIKKAKPEAKTLRASRASPAYRNPEPMTLDELWEQAERERRTG